MEVNVSVTNLVTREDHSIGNDDVLATTGSEDNHFGNVVRREGLAASASC